MLPSLSCTLECLVLQDDQSKPAIEVSDKIKITWNLKSFYDLVLGKTERRRVLLLTYLVLESSTDECIPILMSNSKSSFII